MASGGQPGGPVLLMSNSTALYTATEIHLPRALKRSQKEDQHPYGMLTEGDTETGGIHETCQKHILDTTVFDNSRQAFSSPETHVSRNRFYLVFLFSSLARLSAGHENES